MRIVKMLAIVFAGAWIAGCAQNVQNAAMMEEEGKVKFTTDELAMYLAGNTQIWTQEATGGEGGAYYAPDGTLRAMWNGDLFESTYSTTDGRLCWHIADGEDCETYFHNPDGSVSTLYLGNEGSPAPLEAGNLIDSMM